MKTLLPIILLTLLVSANTVKSQSNWQFDYVCNITTEDISIKFVDNKYCLQDRKLRVKDYCEMIEDSIITIDTILLYVDTFEIEHDSTSMRYFHINNGEKNECATLPLVTGEKSFIPHYPDDERLFFLPKGEIKLIGKSWYGNHLFYVGETSNYSFELTLDADFFIPLDFEIRYRGEGLRRFINLYKRNKKMYFLNKVDAIKEE